MLGSFILKVKGLDGKEYKLTLKNKPRGNASKLHVRARNLLAKLFPNDIIYEEVLLKGSAKFNKKNLYADFFIKSRKMIVEVQGQQHFKKTFFHGTKLEFLQAKANDSRKREWCEINEIIIIELPYGESDEEWSSRFN